YLRDAIPETLPNIFYEKTRTNYRLPLVHLFKLSGSVSNDPFYIKITHLTGGTLGDYTTTETLYDDNENPTVVKETKMSYDYDNHYQPVAMTTVTSDGEPIIETFLYPQSISSPNSVEEDLLNQNRLVPLEIKTYKDVNNDGYSDTSEQLSATKTIYDWFASGSVLEPKTIQTSKDSSLLTDRIEFKAYDSDGNILQVRKTDGIDICYIYGYDNYLPIAKIENAAYSQV